MSPRAQALVFLILAGVSGALTAAFVILLPLLSTLPVSEIGTPPLWRYAAPAVGGLATATLVMWRSRCLRRGVHPEELANLPGQAIAVFVMATLAAIVFGLLLAPDPLLARRPAVVLIGAPALLLTCAQVLRSLIQAPLVAEMTRLLTSAPQPPAPTLASGKQIGPAALPVGHPRRASRWLGGLVVVSIRPAMAVTAVLLSASMIALIGVHTHARGQSELEELAQRHLDDLLRVVSAEVARLPADRVAPFIAGFPPSSRGTPVVVERDGRVHDPGVMASGSRLVARGRTCQTGQRALRCAVGPPLWPDGPHLAVLGKASLATDPALVELRNQLLLLALVVVLVAALLGWAIGGDISRDFHVMAHQLEAMSRQDQPDLGRPVTVTSIDEVGDLTAALGKLRLRLEQELDSYRQSLRKTREADRIKNMFFSDVSHELRTPLTTICGYSQLLTEDNVGELTAAQREDMRIIHNAGHQLLGLFNDVIDISVIESGDLTLNLEKVDVGAVCREIVRGQTAVARKKSESSGQPLELRCELEDGLPIIVAVPLRLRQLVQNMLSNALKFTDEGSIVVRTARQGSGLVRITVSDTGIGISAAELGQVFERYRQVGSIKAQRQGSGLGLGICKHLVELHGGEISVQSEVQRGTTFTVILPEGGPDPAGRARAA
jgi:signal transduction histidine kinase